MENENLASKSAQAQPCVGQIVDEQLLEMRGQMGQLMVELEHGQQVQNQKQAMMESKVKEVQESQGQLIVHGQEGGQSMQQFKAEIWSNIQQHQIHIEKSLSPLSPRLMMTLAGWWPCHRGFRLNCNMCRPVGPNFRRK